MMSASAVSSAIRPLLTRRLLQHRLMQRLSRRPFHLTALREKKYTKFTEVLNKNRRGRTEPVGVKKMESSKPVVHIFDGINLSQLAVAAGKELDTMFDCILEISSEKMAEKCLERPDEPLPRELVLDLLSYLHMRPQLGPQQPKAKEVDHTEMDLFAQPPPPADERKKRAPVVTIMGHVDHGKTTLLDALRRSNIVAQEFGGITQHIGAFSVKLPDVGDEPVTFLDTPGHSAFKAMRERGARATDIVVLVVAADDGVMEQTVESIRYARESGVPMIVAINKCDKPGVDAEAVLQDLLRHEIVTEKFGGDTLAVQISALYGRGLDKLQEAILLQAELMQLESTSEGAVEATIIEASQMQGLGNVCTLIVNRGTLRKGTILVAGTSWGKVRAMSDEWNAQVPEAGPSTPVRIAGWRDELPAPGELALEAPNESKAQAVVQHRRRRKQEAMLDRDREVIDKMRAEARLRHQERRRQLFEKGVLASRNTQETPKTEEEKAADLVPRLSIVLKCDVDGTLEAIQSVLSTYDAHDQVRLDVVHSAVGPVSETDLELAAETGAHIVTFNSPIHRRIQAMAEQRHVRLEEFHVIYKLVERLKEMLSDKMQPMVERRMLGGGTVIHVYRIPDGLKKKQPIAGIRVDWGTLERKATWRFLRPTKAGAGDSDKSKSAAKAEKENRTAQKQADESIEASGLGTLAPIYEGSIESMQCEKQSINKATTDMEIGVAVEDKSVRYKEGDQVEVFEDFTPPQRIRWHPPGF